MPSAAPDIRVVTFDGPGTPPVLRRVPRPSVPPRGALIRIEACGVCGTDLHILQGHWPGALPWPITLGHELAGVVEEIGPQFRTDATGAALREGDHVMLPPLNACGVCEVCVETPERANKCLNPTYYGRKISYQPAAAPLGRVGRHGLRGPGRVPRDQALSPAGRHAADGGHAGRAVQLGDAGLQSGGRAGASGANRGRVGRDSRRRDRLACSQPSRRANAGPGPW